MDLDLTVQNRTGTANTILVPVQVFHYGTTGTRTRTKFTGTAVVTLCVASSTVPAMVLWP